MIGGRDMVEEFVAAKVWPLSCNWLPSSFSKMKVNGLKDLDNLNKHASVVERTRDELKDWIRSTGNNNIKNKAGV